MVMFQNNKGRKKLIPIVLIIVILISCIVGCGKKTHSGYKESDKTNIEIVYLTQLGTTWFEAMIAAFEEKYPEYNVVYTGLSSRGAMRATYGLEDTDSYDLYVGTKMYDATYMESLNDILETTVDGESKTIGEKFNASYLQLEEYNGNYYMLTCGGGIYGFVYNKDLFKKAGIDQVPRTTDEFAITCDMLTDANITPLCHFNSDGYYVYMNYVWWAQYDGVDYWKDFYANPTKEKMNTKDGRYQVLKVHEKINTPDNVLPGSNSDSAESMYAKFFDEKCAITLAGTDVLEDKYAMMKTPVISSITDKLTSVKTDKDLRELITAIDDVTDGVKSEDAYKDGDDYVIKGKRVTEADWNYVKTARNMAPITYTGNPVFIPTYSNAKEGAKKFITFMYSDEGYQTYLDAAGVPWPLSLSNEEIDTSEWGTFAKEQVKRMNTTEVMISERVINKHELYRIGGADPFANYLMVANMCAQRGQDRTNAAEVWDAIQASINEKYEKVWMDKIK